MSNSSRHQYENDAGSSARAPALNPIWIWLAGGAIALLIVAVATIFWPGIPMYDTVAQYGEVLSNQIDDWHPPVMVRLWQLLHPLAPGTAPMFVLQVALYAVGFGMLVAAFTRNERWGSAIASAFLALSPFLLGWQMVVLKDTQMLGAMIAALALLAHYRLAARTVPPVAVAVAALLAAYATLVRANAVFATAPLVAFLLPRPRTLIGRGLLALTAIAALLLATPFIDHRIFGAAPSGVAKTQPLFDLAAIAVAMPGSPSPFTSAERAEIVRRHCVKAFFWDPLGEPTACGPVVERLQSEPERILYLDLARAVVSHPFAYAEHRLRHWNSTERWLVEPNLPEAEPPDEAENNDIGLLTPASPIMPEWQSVAAAEAGTPLGWPIVWTVIAALLIPAAWRRRDEAAGNLALALVSSVLTLEASFLVVSIASDIRYHLWSITASGLALIILSDELRQKWRAWIGGALLVGIIVAGGLVTRYTLPVAPSDYQAMIHAPSG
ncbi:MAG TPA: hypothetical protein VID20_05445 [Sphingomicrobium sp.]